MIGTRRMAAGNAVGVFDISHMGRLQFFGPDVAAFLDSVCTRRVVDMKVGQIRYSLVCNERGGILDDVLVYRVPVVESGGAKASDDLLTFQMVVNASNREKIVGWLKGRLHGYDLRMDDVTRDTTMIAVQGPRAIDLVRPHLQGDLSAMRYYFGNYGRFDGMPCFVSRTGYTGEDGCEIVGATKDALAIWDQVISAAEKVGGQSIGLGARDTLRLEAAMPLYGHELSESINPFQAGLGFAVNLDGREFVGRDALKKIATDKAQPARVGLQLDGKRVPREGYPVLQGEEKVGEVTSGTFSPTFERPIAMAYVRPSAQAVGTRLAVDIRGTQHPAVVVPLPFYERGKKK
jgi:aminomethyltransferase